MYHIVYSALVTDEHNSSTSSGICSHKMSAHIHSMTNVIGSMLLYGSTCLDTLGLLTGYAPGRFALSRQMSALGVEINTNHALLKLVN